MPVSVLVGVVLIVFLLLVKMTVSSGTIWFNLLCQYSIMVYWTTRRALFTLFFVYSYMDKLGLWIEVCFYSRMEDLDTVCLSLLHLVPGGCHHSVLSTGMKLMGMRNIEVLATVFLLSYAKLLIVTSLSFTDIMVASTNNVSDPIIPQRVRVYSGHMNINIWLLL